MPVSCIPAPHSAVHSMPLPLCIAVAVVAVALGALPDAQTGDRLDLSEQRAASYVPYDGSGRYTMDTDDGVRGIQGLAALAERFGVKPYAELSLVDGRWLTERLIFRDMGTGATVVRLTNDSWADQLSYFKGNWTADGKYIVFRRRPGMWESSTDTHGPMAMLSDGSGLRNVFRDYRMVRKEVCSPTEPGICYAMADGRKVVAFDVETGGVHHLVREVLGCWHLKVSLDGKYLMGRSDIEAGGRGLWIVSTDGGEYHEIPIPEAIHDSYQFHPLGDRIMYWYEGRYRTEGFVQRDLTGGPESNVNVLFDWNHGDVGLDRGAHTGGYITRIEGGTWLEKEPLFHAPGVEYYDDPHNYNGYLTWSPKDQLWVYSTRIVSRPHLSEIHCYHAEPVPGDVVNRYRICYTGLERPGCLDNPGASPDGTKVLFNSNMLGSVDAYYVVARLPEAPSSLSADRDGDGVRLTWTPPPHHAEVAGYHVYRSAQSGIGYVPLTTTPVASTEYVDRDAPQAGPCFYAVTSVEHSGLESGLSSEIAVAAGAQTPRRFFLEAEAGQRSPAMWVAHQSLASDLHYVWMRSQGGGGRLSVPVTLPKPERSWHLWARVKGPDGAEFTAELAGQVSQVRTPPSHEWTWARFPDTVAVGGEAALAVGSELYGSAIDSFVLTDDPDFAPDASPRMRPSGVTQVQGLKAEALSPYAVRLSWEPSDDPGLHHYDVYCGPEDSFACSQASLIASPDQPAHVDWGLRPGTRLFYRVVAVDRWGNRAPPSGTTEITLPDLARVVLEEEGAEQIAFEVPVPGTYVLWLKLKQGERGGNYIDVKMDDQRATWTCAFDGLSDESWFSYDQWGRFLLEAGPHALALENKTNHTLQRVILTNDFSLKPEGHVNILSGW